MKKKNLCQKQSCLSAKNNFLCEHHRKKWFLKPAQKQINTYRPITDPQLDRPHLTFPDFPCKKTSVWNKPINSILMTCHHPNLDSASDWLQPVPGSQNEIVGKIEWGRSERERFLIFIFMLRFLNPRGPDYLGAWNRLDWLEQISLIIATTDLKHQPDQCSCSHSSDVILHRKPAEVLQNVGCFVRPLNRKKWSLFQKKKCETLNIF